MSESRSSNIAAQRIIVLEELNQHKLYSANLHKRVFLSKLCPLPQETDIKGYLKSTGLYNTTRKRWRHLPPKVSVESKLYEPFKNIIKDIFSHFRYEKTRSVENTHTNRLPHKDPDGPVARDAKDLKSGPDIMILGSGKIEEEEGDNFPPELEKPVEGKNDEMEPKASYVTCVSPVEIKMDSTRTFGNHLGQISVYARQCFIQQHNRKYVYALLLSQSSARLLMFDRSGLCYSDEINIHKDPEGFVRMILGISSPDCAAVGFDTNIYWKDGKRYIKMVNEHNQAEQYEIIHSKGWPYFCRGSIKGRGTCCWQVCSSDKTRYLIKDQWASDGRVEEEVLHHDTKGLEFVGQMVSFQHGTSTVDLRGFKKYSDLSPEDKKEFRNRKFSRIVFVYGGRPIDKFQTREEVLIAMRDAIKGHQQLWKAKIIHRDISTNNILIHTTTSGTKGILIDLDMAVKLDRTKSLAETDFRTGTPAFQSINVLYSWGTNPTKNLPHDYLDDLESFYYVLCWLAEGYDGPALPKKDLPKHLKIWLMAEPDEARERKVAHFVMVDVLQYSVSHFWGPEFMTLLSQLYHFFSVKVSMKRGIRSSKQPMPSADECNIAAEQDYTTILTYFDEAIDKIVAQRTRAQKPSDLSKTPDATTHNATFVPPTLLAGQKRASEHDHDMAAKRSKQKTSRSSSPNATSLENSQTSFEVKEDDQSLPQQGTTSY